MSKFGALHILAGYNQPWKIKQIQKLISDGANPNECTKDGLTPLHIAAMWGCNDTLACLLQVGANPWLKDCNGSDAFDYCEEYQEKVCLLLLNNYLKERQSKCVGIPKTNILMSDIDEDLEWERSESSSLSFYTAAEDEDDTPKRTEDVTVIENTLKTLELVSPSRVEQTTHREDESVLIETFVKPSKMTPDCYSSNKPLPDEYNDLKDEQINLKMIEFGLDPVPITPFTRKVVLQKVYKLSQLSSVERSNLLETTTKYTPELDKLFKGSFDFHEAFLLDKEIQKEFDAPNPAVAWREGTLKSCFNYILLDPQITQNLIERSRYLSKSESLLDFVKAIFYVGKGSRSRPYAHLFEAQKSAQDKNKILNTKVTRIWDIWKKGYGVISLHCFQNVIPVEAYCREACIIEALGLTNLTNSKSGELYGCTSSWNCKKKRQLGSYLIYRAFNLLLHEGERQLHPKDIAK